MIFFERENDLSTSKHNNNNNKKMTTTGVLYFSRVPRDMRPNEIREFFQRFGEIFRQKFIVAATKTRAGQNCWAKKIGKKPRLGKFRRKLGPIPPELPITGPKETQQMNAKPCNQSVQNDPREMSHFQCYAADSEEKRS